MERNNLETQRTRNVKIHTPGGTGMSSHEIAGEAAETRRRIDSHVDNFGSGVNDNSETLRSRHEEIDRSTEESESDAGEQKRRLGGAKEKASKVSSAVVEGAKKTPLSTIFLGGALVSFLVERKRSCRKKTSHTHDSDNQGSSSHIRNMRENLPSGDELKEHTKSMHERSKEKASYYSSKLRSAVREEPLTACVVAACLGTLTAFSIGRQAA